jgi:tRNA A-37 threonylcarbamoyl transferase component Bud32
VARAQRRFRAVALAALAAFAILAAVGTWTYSSVRGSLRDVRAAGLLSQLSAEAGALRLWIREKERDAQRWASNPEVQRHGARLVQLAAAGAVCPPREQAALQAQIAPYTEVEEVTVFNLIARDGRIVSSSRTGHCGAIVTPQFRQRLAPVFEGQTVFISPLRDERRLGAAAVHNEELAWIETPVRENGVVVAALGFGRQASEAFANLLAHEVGGTTRDAYAFDDQLTLVTASKGASFGAAVRDPAGAPTALATAAIAHAGAHEGVILEPYRNHRGIEVIGAWRWLPHERLAVGVEIEAAQAYGPLAHLQVAFGVLFALALLSLAAGAGGSLWAARARLRESRRIGLYRIERQIGAGGMSDVYLATHEELKRRAAVKVLKPSIASDEVVTRFRREAQLCSQLSHPNTVEIYDYGMTPDGRWYYAMEYLEGISVENIVRQSGPMPLARVLHVLRKACGSLEEAHARGWVHRDVKPNNIMLCVRGGAHDVVKVVDFGLIKQVRNPDTRDITQFAKVLGTPLYMAPERLRDPADADARVDIYALAAVAHFALTGRAPFDAQTDHDIVYRVMNEPPPSLAQDGFEGAPAVLEDLLARCLAKDRRARPGSMAQVRVVIERLLASHPWTEDEARAWWSAFYPNIP